jgi:signal transduction histidine kinase
LDIKSKNNKIIGIIIAWILVLVTAFTVVKSYTYVWDRTEKNKTNVYESYTTFQFLSKMSYALYIDVAEEREQRELTPLEVYAPEYQEMEKEEEENLNSYEGEDEYTYDFDNENNLPKYISTQIGYWRNIVENNANVNYVVRDDSTGKTITSSSKEFYEMNSNKKEGEYFAGYPFSFELSFDANGKASASNVIGANQEVIQGYLDYLNSNDESNHFIYNDYGYIDATDKNFIKLENPKNITIIFAIPEQLTAYDHFYNNVYYEHRSNFFNPFVIISILSIVVIFLAGIILYVIKPLKLGSGLSSKIPFEINLAEIMSIPFGIWCIGELAFSWCNGYTLDVEIRDILSIDQINGLSYGLHVVLWFLLLGAVMIMTLSLLQVFRIGLKRYCKEKVLFIRFFRWIGRQSKRVYNSLISFDLSDKSNKIILRIVVVNFLILLVLCSIWFFGIPILFIYSIVLFIVLKRIYKDIQDKYSYLLKVTNRMAEGDLEVVIEEDLGVFEPLKEEMKKIQTGFKKAVQEEVKSQSMKTELITNVSHDLKTPLTAIITYIDLLKDENLSEEERQSYILTLEQKSYRLKTLIEDLFEMSKATSKNIEIVRSEVDIVALIKQAELELSDQLEAAHVYIRMNLPEDKVILNLDGQKTYRIFDNLFVNISKYTMEHTRAYVLLEETNNQVIVTLKNISATELDFEGEEITERFVRGDKSRTTEGSGLGLAIVKSFMELQGGELRIVVDGDLFKVILTFNK